MEHQKTNMIRRDFLKSTTIAGAAVLAGAGRVFPAGSEKIRVGLIGCGGRGTDAGIIDCAQSSKGIELVAMGDLFPDHLETAPAEIKANLHKRELPVDEIYKVTSENMFVGWDAYQKVINCDVDMVILTTPPNFRPLHFRAAVQAGKHVFVEKPVAVDPIGLRSVLESGELAKQKGLTVVAGTQMRRFEPMIQTIRRLHDGAIGQIIGGQVVRTGGAMRDWRVDEKMKRAEWSDIDYHIRRWLFWTWLSGDFIVEMHVHNLDVMNWILGAHPVSCLAMGGRQVRTEAEFGNVYDHFAAEYLYPNGARIQYLGTQIDKFTYRNDQRVQGTLGSAYLDFGNAKITGPNAWDYKGEHPNPAVQEYADMIDSIRNGRAINETQQVAESTMTAILGRMSAYTGREVKWDWIMQASELDLTPRQTDSGLVPDSSIAVPGVTELI